MSVSIPTTQEQKDANLANFEASLNQTVPDNEKSFLRVTSAVEALQFTALYKFGVDAVLQNLALTATREDLDRLGSEYGVIRRPATFWEGVIVQDATAPDTTIPISIEYVSDVTAKRYRPQAETILNDPPFSTDVSVIAVESGIDSNATDDEPATMSPLIAGADPSVNINLTTILAVDIETDESYRRRILNEIRTVGGGGNSTDYRTWAEQVSGVAAAYPYAGRVGSIPATPSSPGDRTVYIEAETTIDPDRVPPQSLLDEVFDTIQNDPDTGRERPPLGLTESQLFVESIHVTDFNVEIRDLQVEASLEAETKTRIESALLTYFLNVRPFIEGLDFELDRNETITDLTVSTVVQDILQTVGGSAGGIGFGITPGEFIPSYTVGPGELTDLGTVTYV